MNQTIVRAMPRRKTSPRRDALPSRASADLNPVVGMISAIELRRLVAAMVD